MFGILNITAVQNYARDAIINDLQEKIGTEIGIKRLSFQPFNTLALDSVYLYDESGRKVIEVNRISASLDLFALLKNKLVISTVILSDFEVHLAKDSSSAPLNIQYIIDAFPPGTREKKSDTNLKLSTIYIENGRFYYDVEDKPFKTEEFDANHIAISELNAKLSIKSILSDSLNIQLKKLSLKEQSGLQISNLITRFITQDKHAALKGFRLDLPESYLEFSKLELDMSHNPDSLPSSLDYAVLDAYIAPSYIAPRDISAFVPALKHFSDLLKLQGHIHGSINDLQASDLNLSLNTKMSLLANANIKNIRDKSKKIYLQGNVNHLDISHTGVEGLINNFSQQRNDLPEGIKELGNIHFEGGISGFLDNLSADGVLNTDIGSFETNLLFGLNMEGNLRSFVKGELLTKQFNLGKITNNKDLGNIALNTNFSFIQTKENKVSGDIVGLINSFEYKKYIYKDIVYDLNYDHNFVDGLMQINTDNGFLGLNGFLNWENPKEPELNLNLRATNIELDDLQIRDDFTDSNISFNMLANLKGKTLDDITGFINIDSLHISRGDLSFFLDKLSIVSSQDDEYNILKLSSDLINLDVQGSYKYKSLIDNISNTLSSHAPSLIKEKKIKDKRQDNISLKLAIENTQVLSEILGLPFSILKPIHLNAQYSSEDQVLQADLESSQFIVAGSHILKSKLLIDNIESDKLKASINLSMLGKKNIINNFDLNLSMTNSLLLSSIGINSGDNKLTKDKLEFEALFSRLKNDQLRIDVDIHPTDLVFNNTTWQISKSNLSLVGQDIVVKTLSINSSDLTQSIDIKGEYSKNKEDDVLVTKLKNIDLAYIFQTLEIDALQFMGQTTGDIYLSSIEGKPYANTNLHVKNFGFNNTELGELRLYSELEDSTKLILLDGIVSSYDSKETKVRGSIDPLSEKLSIYFDADSINIAFLEHYAKSVFSHVSGHGSGKVHLHGNFSKVTVEGDALINNGRIGISFINTEYAFTDSVHLTKNLIYFNDIKLMDSKKNVSLASGKLLHDYFSNFIYHIDLTADNFLLYNTTEKQNPVFFGTVYGSGNGSIGGDEQELNIDISMQTKENTKVRMNFMKDVVSEYSFINYKGDLKNEKTLEDDIFVLKAKTEQEGTSSAMAINMNFYIDATPDAQVEILMDPVGGDIISAKGNGTIQFQWNQKDSPRLYGTYNINRGNYNFTFQRLMERKFNIEDGSTVQFHGDPFEAILNVNAIYKVTANLNDLDRQLVKSTGQSSIPVNCMLNLTGPLRSPFVNLDVGFPAADSEVARQIKSLMNTEDMISRQVTYLLLLNKFYTPDHIQNEYRTSDFAAIASATLSNQLTKIVNQIDSRWQLGTNIRTSDADFSETTATEVELMLSSQLLNNRLLINGNFGYRDDPSVQEDVAFIGDVDVEFLLNNSGTWRIKAYNHYNEKYYYNGSSTQTQGVGIMYKRDFDYFGELLFWRRKKKKENANTNKLKGNESPDNHSFMEYK